MADIYDQIGRRFAIALIETCWLAEEMPDTLKGAAMTALEEFTIRATGHPLDWETIKSSPSVKAHQHILWMHSAKGPRNA